MLMSTKAQMIFEEKNTTTGLIFAELFKAHVSYDSFKLTYYIDLKSFSTLESRIGKVIDSTHILCKRTQNSACNITISQLKQQLTTITNEWETTKMMEQRHKRAVCNFCGKFGHWFSGYMDIDSAKAYDEKINELQRVATTQHLALTNQTLIVETLVNGNLKTQQMIEQHLKQLNDRQNVLINGINEQLDQTSNRISIQECTTIISLLVDEHNRMLNNIHKCMEHVRTGRIPALVSKRQLINDIKLIASSLKVNQKLPIDILSENILHIFKFTTIRSTLFSDYTLYKLVPVPVTLAENTVIIKPTFNFFLLNTEGTKFIQLSQQQIDDGIPITPTEMLYSPSVVTQLRSETICVWNEYSTIIVLKMR